MTTYNVVDLIPIVEVDFKDPEQLRGLLLRLQKNFDELQSVLETVQGYENKTGIASNVTVATNKAIWDLSNNITAEGKFLTSKLSGAIETLTNQINAGAGTVTLTDNNGILITDSAESPTKALRLLGGAFAIANSKTPQGAWEWSSFGTGEGFTADLLTSGQILTTLINIVGDKYYTKLVGDGFRVYDRSGALAGHFGHYEALDTQIAAFTRASTAYKQDGTLVASGVERYEYTRIPGPVWQDLFATDLLASEYTSGGDIVADWAVTGGKLTGAGGSLGTLIKNDLLVQDLEIEVNCDEGTSGGIIARYQDNNNFYFLRLIDDSSDAPNDNVCLFKKVGGSFSAISPAGNIVWARGTSKLIKLALQGSLIEVWVAGVKVISITDTSFTGGGVGVLKGTSFLDFKVYSAQQGVMIEEVRTNLIAAYPTGWGLSGAGMVATDQGVLPGAALNTMRLTNSVGTEGDYHSPSFTLAPSTAYTLRFKAKGTVAINKMDAYILSNSGTYVQAALNGFALTSLWTVYTIVFTTTADISGVNQFIRLDHNGADAGYIDIAEISVCVRSYPNTFPGYGATRNAEVLTVPTAGIFTKGNWTIDTELTSLISPGLATQFLWSMCFDPGTFNNLYEAGLNSSGQLFVSAKSGGTQITITDNNVAVIGVPYHITLSGDGTHLRLCVNGAQIGADTDYTEPAGALPANMSVGYAATSGTAQANSILSNFRISSIARTLAQHIADYATGRPLEVDEYTTYLMSCDEHLQPQERRFGLKVVNGEMTLIDPPVDGGIQVYDNLGALRCHVGQYAAGKYGAKIVNGEIYSSLFRTGVEGATSYISLEDNELKVYENGLLTMKMTCQEGGHGYLYLYEGGVNTLIISGQEENPGLIAKQGYLLNLTTLASNASIVLNTDGSIDIDPTATDNTCTIFGNFAVTGSGKGCIVETKDYGPRWLYAVEAPDIRLEQKGAAQLVDGRARVDLNPIFLQTIEPDLESAPWVIDITPYFDAKLYISEINSVEGWFIVKECGGGLSAGRVAWSLSAVKIGCIDLYIPEFKPEGDILTSGWEDEYVEVI